MPKYEIDMIRYDLFKAALPVAINMPPTVGMREVVAAAMDLADKSVEMLIKKGILLRDLDNDSITVTGAPMDGL